MAGELGIQFGNRLVLGDGLAVNDPDGEPCCEQSGQPVHCIYCPPGEDLLGVNVTFVSVVPCAGCHNTGAGGSYHVTVPDVNTTYFLPPWRNSTCWFGRVIGHGRIKRYGAENCAGDPIQNFPIAIYAAAQIITGTGITWVVGISESAAAYPGFRGDLSFTGSCLAGQVIQNATAAGACQTFQQRTYAGGWALLAPVEG